eukprot:1589004-Prymnesium_polylepis.1
MAASSVHAPPWPHRSHHMARAAHRVPCQWRPATTHATRRLASHGPQASDPTTLRRIARLPDRR